MSYTALYRKFRPATFDEIVGQEHIIKTLKNQIISNRVGHAYLFNGGRGTGKTSAAKILARAINCLNPQDGEPCNECEICKGAINGSLTDIVEMDAASNNSVEDIRSIREEVNFLPTLAKYRVYIIDEVHMLSTGAFNALLKTLEEPPEHVKFILATTEPQKLPATILSRCQRFDFKKISDENIVKRLKIVCKQSNIQITDEALNVIASLSEGAMRDALSILERCVQEGEENINEDKVKELVGIPKITYVHRMLKAIVEYDVTEAINCIEELISQGKDINNILWELIKYTKDVLVYKASKELKVYSKQEIENISKLSELVEKDRLLYIIYNLSELENQMKWSSQRTIMFQTGIIKLCTKYASEDITELKNRIENVENLLKSGKLISKSSNIRNNPQDINKDVDNFVENSKKQKEKGVEFTGLGTKTEEYWPKLVDNLKKSGKVMLYTNLINTKAVELNDMTVGIEFPNGMTPFGKKTLETQETINELSKLVSMACGKEMKIKYIDKKQEKKKEDKENTIENYAKDLDLPINIIED